MQATPVSAARQVQILDYAPRAGAAHPEAAKPGEIDNEEG